VHPEFHCKDLQETYVWGNTHLLTGNPFRFYGGQRVLALDRMRRIDNRWMIPRRYSKQRRSGFTSPRGHSVHTDGYEGECNANGWSSHAYEDPDNAGVEGLEDDCDEVQDRKDGCTFQNNANDMEKVDARMTWLNTRGTRCSELTDETKADEARSQNILETDNQKNKGPQPLECLVFSTAAHPREE